MTRSYNSPDRRSSIKMSSFVLCCAAFFFFAFSAQAQVGALEIDKEKEKKYEPYLQWRHHGSLGLAEFKKSNPYDYLKELWYYAESFYIRRDYFFEGVTLDESMIDISRFETSRKEDEEQIVVLPGFKDVLVLLPQNKLIYNPTKGK